MGQARNYKALVSGELVNGEPEVADWKELLDRGFALVNSGRCGEAIAIFDRVIDIKPDEYQVLSLRGIVLCMLGQFEDAIDSFDRALEIQSNDSSIWFERGNALSELGKHEDAISSWA